MCFAACIALLSEGIVPEAGAECSQLHQTTLVHSLKAQTKSLNQNNGHLSSTYNADFTFCLCIKWLPGFFMHRCRLLQFADTLTVCSLLRRALTKTEVISTLSIRH
jgi:hypothetical protein